MPDPLGRTFHTCFRVLDARSGREFIDWCELPVYQAALALRIPAYWVERRLPVSQAIGDRPWVDRESGEAEL